MSIKFVAGTDYQGDIVGVRLTGCATIENFNYAFVLLASEDGGAASTALKCVLCQNGIWATAWASLDAPPVGIDFDATHQGTALSFGTMLWVFVCGGDGHVWGRGWNGLWLDWVKCEASGPAYPLKSVDRVFGQFLYVEDANGQAWALANAGTQWIAAKADSSMILNSVDKPLAFLMGGGYFCALTISENALLPRLYQDTGVHTGRWVHIAIGTADGSDMSYRSGTGAQACIAAWRPSSPDDVVTTPWHVAIPPDVDPGTAGFWIDVSTIPGAENGMVCWAMIRGGNATSVFEKVDEGMLYIAMGPKTAADHFNDPDREYSITHDSSAANFNYRTDVDSSVMAGYTAAVKGTIGITYWSFSNASMFVGTISATAENYSTLTSP